MKRLLIAALLALTCAACEKTVREVRVDRQPQEKRTATGVPSSPGGYDHREPTA